MAALKIDGVTLHSVRHTHASQLIASGMDILDISRRLGHGSAAITLAVYGHLIAGSDSKAAEHMETMFAGPQYGNVATLEAAKQAFRAAWDRRPKWQGRKNSLDDFIA